MVGGGRELRDLRSFEEVGVDKFKGLYFLLHGGRESLEDTEVFEALCFWGLGFTI